MIVTVVLLKMTGIPLTEKTITSTRPGYLEYVRRTNAFFRWFPRRREGEKKRRSIWQTGVSCWTARIRLGIRFLDKQRLAQEERIDPEAA